MNCPKCSKKLKKIEVGFEGAKSKAVSYQCNRGHYAEFEPESMKKVIKEVDENESVLKIKQKIIKLSKDRLGMYFNKNIVESLMLKAGEEINLSVPDKKHIVLTIS